MAAAPQTASVQQPVIQKKASTDPMGNTQNGTNYVDAADTGIISTVTYRTIAISEINFDGASYFGMAHHPDYMRRKLKCLKDFFACSSQP